MSACDGDPKRRLVDLLVQHRELSGERIATALGVSRSAVWKQIQALRADGFDIAGTTGKGYRLLKLTDRLVAYEIERRIHARRIGRRVICLDETTSTNDEIRALAAQGEPEGVCVFAERQTAGRGRRGRAWWSVPGRHLTGSLLLRPPLEPANAQHLSLLASLAAARAIRAATGLEARTKWPNDVVLAGSKVGGVLVEMQAEPDRLVAATIGIGINVNGTVADLPDDPRATATTIEECLGAPADRLAVLCALLEEMDALYDGYLARGPTPLLELWRGADTVLGRWVTARTPRGALEGRAIDVGPDGSLILAQGGGRTASVVAGDVSLSTATRGHAHGEG
jgi:BirA family biotin operon repressor/biotin-[acetyl-CoA-carboxylase] ligase